MTNGWLRDQHRKRETPEFWWLVARRLKRAGELCWEAYDDALRQFHNDPEIYFENEHKAGTTNPDLELSGMYFFLLALAIENLIKGALIATGPSWLSDKKKEKDLHSHKISKLIECLDIPLDADTRFLIEQLEISIRWADRYPTPRKQDDFKLQKAPDGSNLMPGMVPTNWKPKVECLWGELERQLERATVSRRSR